MSDTSNNSFLGQRFFFTKLVGVFAAAATFNAVTETASAYTADGNRVLEDAGKSYRLENQPETGLFFLVAEDQISPTKAEIFVFERNGDVRANTLSIWTDSNGFKSYHSPTPLDLTNKPMELQQIHAIACSIAGQMVSAEPGMMRKGPFEHIKTQGHYFIEKRCL